LRRTIIAVGRCRDASLLALWRDYAGRLKPPLGLIEVEDKRGLAPDRKAREAQFLLDKVPQGARLVALDEGGQVLSSLDFSKKLSAWRDQGVPEVAFLIGGADGLDPAIPAQASLVLSLGAMTWPHMLVRVMLAEQLFRAESIATGHPYHRA
jgi:23S rRNA (pseudouridine1915-N3)-methyltransferase